MYSQNNAIEMQILIKGKPIEEFYHRDGNVYIEGRKGSDYELRVKNNTNGRILAVLSVDGLSVMDGKLAGLNSDGYVLNGYAELIIPGWRLDKNNVAKFMFSDASGSYNTQTGGNPSNVGVIGLMAFNEKVIQQYRTPFRSFWSDPGDMLYGSDYIGSSGGTFSSNVMPQNAIPNGQAKSFGINSLNVSRSFGSNEVMDASACSDSSDYESNLGTGFGQETAFNTVNVAFNKANINLPDYMMAVFYDSARGLQKRGIDIKRYRVRQTQANPFPGYVSTTGCTPPKNWRR